MILVTDTHLDCYRQFSTVSKEGINSRLMDQLGVIGAVGQLIEETNTTNVIFLGDLFNSLSDSLPKLVYNAAFALCKSWSKNADLYLLVGNHDITKGFHLFSAFADLPRIHVVSHTERLRIENQIVDLVPWGGVIPKTKGDVLMGHIAIRGTVVNAAGTVIDEGLSPLDLQGYKQVYLGHYHERQSIPVPGAERAEYIGSLMQIDRGSSPEPRGVVALRSGEYDFFPIQSPHIYSVQIPSQGVADNVVQQMSITGNYWHLTVTSPEVKLPSFDHRVQVEYDLPFSHETRLEEKEGEDLFDTVKRFIEGANTAIDKERALELLKEIM